MMTKATAAIVGPGNIGTDLLAKLQRSEDVEVAYMVGVDPASEGLERARRRSGVRGVRRGAWTGCWAGRAAGSGVRGDLGRAHLANAPRYAEAGIQVVDLTPAAIGPMVCPPVKSGRASGRGQRQHDHLWRAGDHSRRPRGVGGHPVPYAEIVASIASRSAGPGTRANIDEFTVTTARAIESIGARRAARRSSS